MYHLPTVHVNVISSSHKINNGWLYAHLQPTVAATTFETLRGQLAGEIPNLVGETESLDIAVKEFRGDIVVAEQDPNIIAEVRAWDIYQKASLEARVMVQLRHPHILGLVGLTLQPLRLLVELAPLGDLKRCVKKFKRAGARLSRKTLQTTVIQVSPPHMYMYACSWYLCVKRSMS